MEDFDRFPVSTETYMFYIRGVFDHEAIFDAVQPVRLDEVTYTETKNAVDRRTLRGAHGVVFSVQLKDRIKGLDLRSAKSKQNGTYFRNQIAITFSYHGRPINVMVFRRNFKIVGCSSPESMTSIFTAFWSHVLAPARRANPSAIVCDGPPTELTFFAELVMRNVKFRMNFFINHRKLNLLLNRPEYRGRIAAQERNKCSNTNVKICARRPDNHVYKTYTVSLDADTIREGWAPELPVDGSRGQTTRAIYNTFIVFNTSEVILSGRYPDDMRDVYTFFVDLLTRNRSEVEEKIDDVEEYRCIDDLVA